MTDEDSNVARVIDVSERTGRDPLVVLLIGDGEREIAWSGPSPAPGDVFLVSLGEPLRVLRKIGSSQPGAWTVETDAMRWRRRNRRGQTRMEALWQRHHIRRAVRAYFDDEGFIEIDAPLLVRGTTPDATIQSFAVDDRYLVTSSEYQIKRLEVAGFDRLYTLAHNYRRADGEGPYRNPEFTMLEWARVGQSLTDIETDAEQVVWRAHRALGGTGRLKVNAGWVDLTPPWDRMTVIDAVERFVGTRLADFSLASITKALTTAGVEIREAWTSDAYFLFSLLLDHIQPHLGAERPVFLQDWPAFETSSTQERPGQPVAERSELFIGGIEISDGFPSLTDPLRQAQAFERQRERRVRAGAAPVETDVAYLDALCAGLPEGAGMALGFDRLVMILTDRTDLKSVLPFAWDEV
jgi:lysyl-tRNA synthetase class 2